MSVPCRLLAPRLLVSGWPGDRSRVRHYWPWSPIGRPGRPSTPRCGFATTVRGSHVAARCRPRTTAGPRDDAAGGARARRPSPRPRPVAQRPETTPREAPEPVARRRGRGRSPSAQRRRRGRSGLVAGLRRHVGPVGPVPWATLRRRCPPFAFGSRTVVELEAMAPGTRGSLPRVRWRRTWRAPSVRSVGFSPVRRAVRPRGGATTPRAGRTGPPRRRRPRPP